VLIRKWGVNLGVLGVVKVTSRSSCWSPLDLALCGQKPIDEEASGFPRTKKKRPLERGHILFCSCAVVVLRFIST
jgi:hypothetical protein